MNPRGGMAMDERTSGNPGSRTVSDELSAAVAEDLETFDSRAAEEEALAALSRSAIEEEGSDGASSGLLSFYDRLREKILQAVEKRGGRLGEGAVRALLLVPDVFILLVRLSLDREVPGS